MSDTESNEQKEKKKSRGALKKIIRVFLMAVAAGLLGGCIFCTIRYFKYDTNESVFDADIEGENMTAGNEESATPENMLSNTTVDDDVTPVTSSDLSAIAGNIMPSVVSIECMTQVTEYDFFGYGTKRNAKSSGTGFIIGQNYKEILVVTNNHVVEDSNSVTVTFLDGKYANAAVKGTDPYYDIAVLSIDLYDVDADTIKKIRIATLGSSDDLPVGSLAMAIGNALGTGQSITVGYISAVNRKTEDNESNIELIQTDAAINPGNSGGPLVNARGEVIGINCAKNVGEAVEGMGYCIPISKAIPVINDLMNREELSPDEIGYIGIEGKDLSSAYAEGFKMPKGIYVIEIEDNSPASETDIHVGDIITHINGREISSMEEWRTVLKYNKIGTELTLTVMSNVRGKYESRDVKVVIAKKPDKKKR